MTRKVWANHRTSLFAKDGDGEMSYLHCVGIVELRATRDKRTAIFVENMPSLFLEKQNFDKRLDFDVVHHECTDRHLYCADDVIIKLRGCRMAERWIDGVIAMRPDEAQALFVHAEFECDEIIVEGGAI